MIKLFLILAACLFQQQILLCKASMGARMITRVFWTSDILGSRKNMIQGQEVLTEDSLFSKYFIPSGNEVQLEGMPLNINVLLQDIPPKEFSIAATLLVATNSAGLETKISAKQGGKGFDLKCNDHLEFSFYGSDHETVLQGPSCLPGEEYVMVVTYSPINKVAMLYINGNLADLQARVHYTPTDELFLIAQDSTTAMGSHTMSEVSQLVIFNRVLTAIEVKTLELPPPDQVEVPNSLVSLPEDKNVGYMSPPENTKDSLKDDTESSLGTLPKHSLKTSADTLQIAATEDTSFSYAESSFSYSYPQFYSYSVQEIDEESPFVEVTFSDPFPTSISYSFSHSHSYSFHNQEESFPFMGLAFSKPLSASDSFFFSYSYSMEEQEEIFPSVMLPFPSSLSDPNSFSYSYSLKEHELTFSKPLLPASDSFFFSYSYSMEEQEENFPSVMLPFPSSLSDPNSFSYSYSLKEHELTFPKPLPPASDSFFFSYSYSMEEQEENLPSVMLTFPISLSAPNSFSYSYSIEELSSHLELHSYFSLSYLYSYTSEEMQNAPVSPFTLDPNYSYSYLGVKASDNAVVEPVKDQNSENNPSPSDEEVLPDTNSTEEEEKEANEHDNPPMAIWTPKEADESDVIDSVEAPLLNSAANDLFESFGEDIPSEAALVQQSETFQNPQPFVSDEPAAVDSVEEPLLNSAANDLLNSLREERPSEAAPVKQLETLESPTSSVSDDFGIGGNTESKAAPVQQPETLQIQKPFVSNSFDVDSSDDLIQIFEGPNLKTKSSGLPYLPFGSSIASSEAAVAKNSAEEPSASSDSSTMTAKPPLQSSSSDILFKINQKHTEYSKSHLKSEASEPSVDSATSIDSRVEAAADEITKELEVEGGEQHDDHLVQKFEITVDHLSLTGDAKRKGSSIILTEDSVHRQGRALLSAGATELFGFLTNNVELSFSVYVGKSHGEKSCNGVGLSVQFGALDPQAAVMKEKGSEEFEGGAACLLQHPEKRGEGCDGVTLALTSQPIDDPNFIPGLHMVRRPGAHLAVGSSIVGVKEDASLFVDKICDVRMVFKPTQLKDGTEIQIFLDNNDIFGRSFGIEKYSFSGKPSISFTGVTESCAGFHMVSGLEILTDKDFWDFEKAEIEKMMNENAGEPSFFSGMTSFIEKWPLTELVKTEVTVKEESGLKVKYSTWLFFGGAFLGATVIVLIRRQMSERQHYFPLSSP